LQRGKLSIFCDHVIEACWLLCVIAAPLFFNPHSYRIFESEKASLSRSLACVMAVAWLIRMLEGGNPFKALKVKLDPLVLPTLILAVANLLSSATSIVPSISFFGSYLRLQGTYTLFSYLMIFFMILRELKTRRQMNRLILTIILTSVPVALYGVIQWMDLDPIPWGIDFAGRVGSSMGNPIFLGGYLIMVFFLTFARLVKQLPKKTPGGGVEAYDLRAILGYAFILLIQSTAIVLTGSRGPWLGWLAGIFLVFLLLTLMTNRRRAAFGLMGVAMTGVVFLFIFNMPDSPLSPLQKVPYLGTLSHLLEQDTGTGKVRVLIWEADTHLVMPHEPLRFPDGTPDRLNLIRLLVGYGPESMLLAFIKFYPPELAHYESRTMIADRSHNQTWDCLINGGIIGLLSYQFLIYSFFAYGLRQIGLIPGKREHRVFAGLWIGLVVFFGAGVVALGKAAFLGLGVAAGVVAALGLYLIISFMLVPRCTQELVRHPSDGVVIAALLAAVLAHFIEIHFGIAMTASQTMFWSFAAILAVLGSGNLPEEVPKLSPDEAEFPSDPIPSVASVHLKRKQRQRGSSVARRPGRAQKQIPLWLGTALGYSFISTAILLTLFYEFVANPEQLSSPGAVFWQGLTYLKQQGQVSYAVPGIIAVVWLLNWVMMRAEVKSWEIPSLGERKRSDALLMVVPLLISLVFVWGLSFRMAALGQVQMQWVRDAVSVVRNLAGALDYYYVWIFLLVFFSSVAMMLERGKRPERWSSAPAWSHAAQILLVLFIWVWIVHFNVDPCKASVFYKQSESAKKQGVWNVSVALIENAVELEPHEDFYYLKLGDAFWRRAVQKSGPGVIRGFNEKTTLKDVLNVDTESIDRLGPVDLLHAARVVLSCAQDLNPLQSDHSINLAALYSQWAKGESDESVRATLIAKSNAYFEQTLLLKPNGVDLWNEWAISDIGVGKNYDKALEKLNHSLALDDRFEQTYLLMGEVYLAENDQDKAARAFERILEINPASDQAYDKLAFLYARQGKTDKAIQANLSLLKRIPDYPGIWNAHKNLAHLYAKIGDLISAVAEAEQAVKRAPKAEEQAMRGLLVQLQQQAKGAAPR
jgi:tetratricopeptide (TPR) repeat protein/O-antigen ligase